MSNIYSARIDRVYVKTKCMNKSLPNVVIIPNSYSRQKEGYAVFYLLQCAGDDFWDWLRNVPELKNYFDKYNFIIVCPEGGRTRWYFDSPVNSTMKFETYISSELVNWVDSNCHTIPNRNKSAISGLSMGGYGVFYFTSIHQDDWGAVGSISGRLDFRPFPNNWDLSNRLGSYVEYPANWEKNRVINLLYLLDGKSLKIIFDCCVNDFFYDANVRVHEKILGRNIPHNFIVRLGHTNGIIGSMLFSRTPILFTNNPTVINQFNFSQLNNKDGYNFFSNISDV